jgi:hypothetical protein
MNDHINVNTAPFWTTTDKGKIQFNSRKTVKFLELYGWGYYQSHKKRTVKKELFHNDDGVLRTHNEETSKKWVLNFIGSVDETEFSEGVFQTPDGSKQDDIIDGWINMSNDQWKKVLNSLTIYSEEEYQGTVPIDVFRDSENDCHIRFQNGVVKITENSVGLIDTDVLKDEGSIWESEQLPHQIEVSSDNSIGLFEQFVISAFKKKDPSLNDEDWTKNYVLDEDQYRSFRQAYGYLIQGHKSLDKLKCVLCYDSEGSFDNPKGGNGKTLTMDSIKYYKLISTIAGKQWMKGDKFIWSDVTSETKFVLINDIERDFNFQDLFNVITDDFQTEGKGVNKVIIPKEKSPKVAITSNGIITGSGSSFERRKHIVEFGNYWKRCVDEKENVSDTKHLGKQLFSQFSPSDWSDFYNFGFRCVQEYLRDGLQELVNDNHVERSKIVSLEGSEGTGELTRWITEWVTTKRVEGGYHEGNGITEGQLFLKFSKDCPELSWTIESKDFHRAFFDFVMMTDGYYYNEHLARHGDTKTSRRWLQGIRGEQENHIKVTSDFDKKFIVELEVDSDPEVLQIFEKLAS